jgi:hypothetical protein
MILYDEEEIIGASILLRTKEYQLMLIREIY